jgi:hypothetical protein
MMPWYVTVYCIGAVLPALAMVAADGWRGGARGRGPDVVEEDLGAAVFVGIAWPIFAGGIAVLAVAWLAGWLARRAASR